MGIVGYMGITIIICTLIYGTCALFKYYKEKRNGKQD